MPRSRRDDLIDAGLRVFYRDGFHTGIDKVLQEGGLSRMTLYNHFKSKDELIVAALRRRDEIFRNGLMKYVERQSADPLERLLAVFDYHEAFFEEDGFSGCMFINAASEFSDPECAIRRVAADHKRESIRYLRTLCEDAGLEDPQSLAEQLAMLLEGAIVTAKIIGQCGEGTTTPACAAGVAKKAATRLIEASRRS